MNLQHIVLFKFPRELTAGEDAQLRAMVASWPEKIGLMTKVRFGTDITRGRNRGYSYLLYTEFPDFETMNAYRVHPVHAEFLAFINDLGCEPLAFDYALDEHTVLMPESLCSNEGSDPMAKTSPDLIPGAATGELAHGSLRLWDAIAISVSVLAPGMAMLLNVSGVAAVSGGSTPLSFLLGGIACLSLAFVVIGFTRRMASAGYAYTYASRSLGKSAGFMAGWLYFFGMICFVPMTMSGVGYLAADLLGLNPKFWILFFFIGMALLIALATIKVRVTTRVQLIVGIVTVTVIVLVDLVTTAKGGSHGQAPGAFTFGHTVSGGFNGVFYGIILGVTSYIGFETAADFGEETANPRRYIPIAIIAATLFAVVFYLWTTYSITIGFGLGNGAKIGADPVALKTVATSFIGSWLGTLVEIGGMLSAFIVCVACATAASRTLFAMGRENVLPAAFGRTSPRFQTPVNATLAVVGIATVMALLIGYPLSSGLFGQPFSNYYFWATTGTLVIIVVYIVLCIGGIAFFWKTRESRNWNPLAHVVVPLIGAIVFGAALYGSVHPTPPSILAWTPLLGGIWLVAGGAVLLRLRARRPESVARIGSILGEEGGTDAAILDA